MLRLTPICLRLALLAMGALASASIARAQADPQTVYVIQCGNRGAELAKYVFSQEEAPKQTARWELSKLPLEKWVQWGFPGLDLSPDARNFQVSPDGAYIACNYIAPPSPMKDYASEERIDVYSLETSQLAYRAKSKEAGDSFREMGWISANSLRYYKSHRREVKNGDETPSYVFDWTRHAVDFSRRPPVAYRGDAFEPEPYNPSDYAAKAKALEQAGYSPDSFGYEQGGSRKIEWSEMIKSLSKNGTAGLFRVDASKMRPEKHGTSYVVAKDGLPLQELNFTNGDGVRRAMFRDNWLIFLQDRYDVKMKRQVQIYSLNPFEKRYTIPAWDLATD